MGSCRRGISEETVYGECVLELLQKDCMTRSREIYKELAKHALDLKLRQFVHPILSPVNWTG
jgi:hypothetical protein